MIKALLLDDEQPSLDKLEKLLHESGRVKIKGKFTEPLVALEFMKTNSIDVAFLDIEMPNPDGIELANQALSIQRRVAVVFVTAYNQYAVEAFRLHALDYLLKPVEPAKLKDLFVRIYRLLIATKENSENLKLPAARISGKELINSIDSFVNNHLSDDNSIVQICSKFMISQPYLSKIFRK